jgi:hypothetical protein
MLIKDVLITARARCEKGWCQKAAAVDAEGNRVDTVSDEAVAWCMLGGMVECDYDTWDPARNLLMEFLDGQYISQFNDTPGRTKEEVLAIFDKAIAAAEERKV